MPDFFQIDICSRNQFFKMNESHFHDNYEIYYLALGEVSYFIEDSIYTLKKGDIILIPPYTLHRTQNSNVPENKRILINFSKDFVNDFLIYNSGFLDFFVNRQISVPKQKQQKTEQILYSLSNEYQNKKDIIMIKALLAELLVLLSRYSLHDDGTNALTEDNNKNDKIISIVRFINSEYANDITLNMLSKKFYICPSYLSRSFKKVTGFTFIEYLNKVRVKEATSLLVNSTYNVTQIALQTGFSSVNHFCKTFKSVVGVSPLNYRKSL